MPDEPQENGNEVGRGELQNPKFTGAPDTIRTCDLCLRRATRYPAELRVPDVPLSDRAGLGNANLRGHAGSMVLPIGHSAMPASLRCAHANGRPTMVIAIRTAVPRWPSARPQPARMNQMMLPITPSGPVPTTERPVTLSRELARWPNGNSV